MPTAVVRRVPVQRVRSAGVLRPQRAMRAWDLILLRSHAPFRGPVARPAHEQASDGPLDGQVRRFRGSITRPAHGSALGGRAGSLATALDGRLTRLTHDRVAHGMGGAGYHGSPRDPALRGRSAQPAAPGPCSQPRGRHSHGQLNRLAWWQGAGQAPRCAVPCRVRPCDTRLTVRTTLGTIPSR